MAVGCMHRREGIVSEEAEFLAVCASSRHPLDLIAPQRYAEKLAPAIAAERAKGPIDWFVIDNAIRLMSQGSDVMIVEGTGGIMTPMDGKITMLRRRQGTESADSHRRQARCRHDQPHAAHDRRTQARGRPRRRRRDQSVSDGFGWIGRGSLAARDRTRWGRADTQHRARGTPRRSGASSGNHRGDRDCGLGSVSCNPTDAPVTTSAFCASSSAPPR